MKNVELTTTLLAQAQGITNPATGNLGKGIAAAEEGSLFASFFITIWQGLISIGALTVIVYFIWGAMEWIYAGGEASKVQKARDKMTQAMIGMIILVSSFVVIGFLSQVFFGDDFDILNLQIPTTESQQVEGSSPNRQNVNAQDETIQHPQPPEPK